MSMFTSFVEASAQGLKRLDHLGHRWLWSLSDAFRVQCCSVKVGTIPGAYAEVKSAGCKDAKSGVTVLPEVAWSWASSEEF